MTEVWTNSEKGNDKLIGIVDDIIYKANPKTFEEAESLAKGLRSGSFDSTKLWEIKASRCNEIRLQDGKPYIEIFWGKKGEEQLRITDEYKRYKFFELIKANTSYVEFTVERWNAFRAGRKQIIAFAVFLGLFLWTLFYAIEAQSGKVYYLENGHYGSLTGIVLGLASLGLAKVITIFTVILGLIVYLFIRKAMKLPTMNRIIINRPE